MSLTSSSSGDYDRDLELSGGLEARLAGQPHQSIKYYNIVS